MKELLPKHVCHLYGSKPGPRVVVFGGTHGDETTGVEVIKTILRNLGLDENNPSGSHEVSFVNGDLFLGIGNPEAVEKNIRSASGVRDLNRCFYEQFFSDEKEMLLADQKRAAELRNLLASADYFFDLHSVSAPNSVPFIGVTTFTKEHARVCKLFPVEYVVHATPILAQDVGIDVSKLEQAPTTCSWVNRHGGVGLAYEMGYQKDFDSTPRALKIILNVLKQIGSIDEILPEPASPAVASGEGWVEGNVESKIKSTNQKVYRLVYCERNKFKNFQFSNDRFTQNWLPVYKGELIGKYEDGEEVRVTQDGILIFVAGKHTLSTNPSLFYLAVLEPQTSS